MVAARVVGVSASEVKPALTIDRGKQAGIQEGQAVVFSGNLVGTVELVGPVTATVRLITAAETSLEVTLQSPTAGQDGQRVTTTARLTEPRDAFVAEPARDKPVSVGDLAHLGDPAWPPEAQGTIVGKVKEVGGHPQKPLLISRVRIEPLIPLKRLDRVTVLVPRPEETGQQQPAARGRRRGERRAGG
jgi:cell shape-determining protein MreC